MKQELETRIAVIDAALEKYLPERDNPQSVIYRAMRYSVFAGGKRLRPILMHETAIMCGGEWKDVEPFACALEMIHTYSLIHDDLPAMDNDDLRRGMPTSHIKFGEATAILAGDALLNKAFEVVSAAPFRNVARAMRAIAVLAASSGTEGMIGGQVADLAAEDREITVSELQYIHKLKTGALIRAACAVGGILSGAGAAELAAVDDYALNLGIAFQIRDDILDVIGDAKTLGKPIGSDAEQGKNTYVGLCGIEEAERLVASHSDKALAALEPFGTKADFLRGLTTYLVKRNN